VQHTVELVLEQFVAQILELAAGEVAAGRHQNFGLVLLADQPLVGSIPMIEVPVATVELVRLGVAGCLVPQLGMIVGWMEAVETGWAAVLTLLAGQPVVAAVVAELVPAAQ
jgi:hypothetical protein